MVRKQRYFSSRPNRQPWPKKRHKNASLGLAETCCRLWRSPPVGRPLFVVLRLPLLQLFSVVDGSVVYETDGDRAPGATHSPAEMQRRAARERRIHGVAIDIAHLRRCLVARIGDAGRRHDFAVPFEGDQKLNFARASLKAPAMRKAIFNQYLKKKDL